MRCGWVTSLSMWSPLHMFKVHCQSPCSKSKSGAVTTVRHTWNHCGGNELLKKFSAVSWLVMTQHNVFSLWGEKNKSCVPWFSDLEEQWIHLFLPRSDTLLHFVISCERRKRLHEQEYRYYQKKQFCVRFLTPITSSQLCVVNRGPTGWHGAAMSLLNANPAPARHHATHSSGSTCFLKEPKCEFLQKREEGWCESRLGPLLSIFSGCPSSLKSLFIHNWWFMHAFIWLDKVVGWLGRSHVRPFEGTGALPPCCGAIMLKMDTIQENS